MLQCLKYCLDFGFRQTVWIQSVHPLQLSSMLGTVVLVWEFHSGYLGLGLNW